MNLLRIVGIIICFAICGKCYCQTGQPKELKIGDKAPDILFKKVLHYKSSTAKLSDFKRELVILDLWSTNCGTCIAAFPKMQKLQGAFEGKIQIILANPQDDKYNSVDNINSILNGVKERTGFYPMLPMPIHDTVINYYFPHVSVPHEIWIDGDSKKVVAITDLTQITAENISAFLKNKRINLPIKNDWSYVKNEPLLINGNGGDENEFVYRSLITHYNRMVGYGSGMRRNLKKEVTGVYFLNSSLMQFIGTAYSKSLSPLGENRLFFEVGNPAAFKWETDTSLLYCYDVSFPPIPYKLFDQAKIIKDDLKKYFNVSVVSSTRRMKCIILTASDKIVKYSTDKVKGIDIDDAVLKKYIRGYAVSEVIAVLDHRSPIPLIDETGISNELVSVEFEKDFDPKNIESLKAALANAGFIVKEEEREVEVAIITDK